MKSFIASCILAATAISVNIEAPKAASTNTLAKLVSQKVDDGEISVFANKKAFDVTSLFLNNDDEVVASHEEQKKAVFDQIDSGFAEIKQFNAEIEQDIFQSGQDELEREIDAIMKEAEQEAADFISDESDASDAISEVENIMDEAANVIKQLNLENALMVKEATKTAFITELTNEASKDARIKNIESGSDSLELQIKSQQLPFKVSVPKIEEAVSRPGETLTRMVCRNGVCSSSIQEDPEFDDFLQGLIQGRRYPMAGFSW